MGLTGFNAARRKAEEAKNAQPEKKMPKILEAKEAVQVETKEQPKKRGSKKKSED